jgi:DNA polymerase elongation subunit (family B)
MIIDARLDSKNGKLIEIEDAGDYREVDTVPAYFYVLVERGRELAVERVIDGDEAWIEYTNLTPVIMKGGRYEPAPDYRAVKVCSRSPALVPRLASAAMSLGFRVGASNVRYIVRNTFDLNVVFFDSVPLYYGFDPQAVENIRQVKGLVLDVEAVDGKPVLASVYVFNPLSEVRRQDVITLELPSQEGELRKMLRDYPLIAGHNILGFDLPLLKRYGIELDTLTKSVVDTSVVLSIYGQSLGVGSSRSLLDVSIMLREQAGITEEELEVKRRIKGRVERLGREEMALYNANDVVLTAKVLNVIYPFLAYMSAATQIPLSEIQTLPPGMVAEYFLLRYIELLGYAPEYRLTQAKLEGERVWSVGDGREFYNVVQVDVKMMYPSFVLHNYIDPTLHVSEGKFDRATGLGLLYSAVKRLSTVREATRKLKKSNPSFEPMDKGVKAILNALAYGVQGKQSGLSIMGNPVCPSRIFYGTREVQFKTIEYLRGRGYKVVYSDTDSFLVAFGGKPGEEQVARLLSDINTFIGKWGLQADLEGVWDYLFIYSKKNYILRGGDKVVVKGSALYNLDRFYLPEAINLHELLRIPDKVERQRYVKEVIGSAPLEELFVRSHQQVWRLISKDVQTLKRMADRRERYIKVLTPWAEKPVITLKKAKGGHLFVPHSSPIFKLFYTWGNTVEAEELNPFSIVEFRSLKLDGELARIKVTYGLGDIVFYEDRLYTLELQNIFYKIVSKGRVREIPMWYEGNYPEHPIGTLKGLVFTGSIKPATIEENTLRKVLAHATIKTLSKYKII